MSSQQKKNQNIYYFSGLLELQDSQKHWNMKPIHFSEWNKCNLLQY